MPAAARHTDPITTEHICDATTKTDGGSDNVIIESLGAHYKGGTHKTDTHIYNTDSNGNCTIAHNPGLSVASADVFVNGFPLGRVNDTYDGCGYISAGASAVEANTEYTPTAAIDSTAIYHETAAIDDMLDQLLYRATGYYTIPSQAQLISQKIQQLSASTSITTKSPHVDYWYRGENTMIMHAEAEVSTNTVVKWLTKDLEYATLATAQGPNPLINLYQVDIPKNQILHITTPEGVPGVNDWFGSEHPWDWDDILKNSPKKPDPTLLAAVKADIHMNSDIFILAIEDSKVTDLLKSAGYKAITAYESAADAPLSTRSLNMAIILNADADFKVIPMVAELPAQGTPIIRTTVDPAHVNEWLDPNNINRQDADGLKPTSGSGYTARSRLAHIIRTQTIRGPNSSASLGLTLNSSGEIKFNVAAGSHLDHTKDINNPKYIKNIDKLSREIVLGEGLSTGERFDVNTKTGEYKLSRIYKWADEAESLSHILKTNTITSVAYKNAHTSMTLLIQTITSEIGNAIWSEWLRDTTTILDRPMIVSKFTPSGDLNKFPTFNEHRLYSVTAQHINEPIFPGANRQSLSYYGNSDNAYLLKPGQKIVIIPGTTGISHEFIVDGLELNKAEAITLSQWERMHSSGYVKYRPAALRPIITKVSSLPGFDLAEAIRNGYIGEFDTHGQSLSRSTVRDKGMNWYVITLERIPDMRTLETIIELEYKIPFMDFSISNGNLSFGYIKTTETGSKGIGLKSAGASMLDAVFKNPDFASVHTLTIDELTYRGSQLFNAQINRMAVIYNRDPRIIARMYPMLANPGFNMPNFILVGQSVSTTTRLSIPGILPLGGAEQDGYVKLKTFFEYVYKYRTPYAERMLISTKNYNLSVITGDEVHKWVKVIGEPEFLEKFFKDLDVTERIASLKERAPKAVPSWFWDSLKIKVSNGAATTKEVLYATVTSSSAHKFYAFLGKVANIATVAISPWIYDHIESRGGLINHLKLRQEEYAERYLLKPGVDLDKLSYDQLVIMAGHDYYSSKQVIGEMVFIDAMDIILYFVGWPIAETYHAFDEAVDSIPDDDTMIEWFMGDEFDLFN